MKKFFTAIAMIISVSLFASPAVSGLFGDFAHQVIVKGRLYTPEEKAALKAKRAARKARKGKNINWETHITAFFMYKNDKIENKRNKEIANDIAAVYSPTWAMGYQIQKYLDYQGLGNPQLSAILAIDNYNVGKKLDNLQDALPAREWERLAANQEEWRESGMKKRMDELMQAGMDRAEAYRKSMTERLETLSSMERSYKETGKIDFDNLAANARQESRPNATTGIDGAAKAGLNGLTENTTPNAKGSPNRDQGKNSMASATPDPDLSSRRGKEKGNGNLEIPNMDDMPNLRSPSPAKKQGTEKIDFDPYAASGQADSGSSAGRPQASGAKALDSVPRGMHAGQDHETSTGQLADSSPVEDLRKDSVPDPNPEPKPKQDAVFVRQGDKLDFADPEPGDEICGEVVATNKDNVGSIAIIMFAEGEMGAYISDSAACRKAKPKNYLCAMVIDRADTSPEIKESGVTAKSMYNISECRLGK